MTVHGRYAFHKLSAGTNSGPQHKIGEDFGYGGAKTHGFALKVSIWSDQKFIDLAKELFVK